MKFNQKDIQVEADVDWATVNVGGYYPVMLKIKNRGPDASLRIHTKVQMPNSETKSPTIEKRISIAQNATANVTFLIPVVTMESVALIQLEKDGQLLDKIEIPVMFGGRVRSIGSSGFGRRGSQPPPNSILIVHHGVDKIPVSDFEYFFDVVVSSSRTHGSPVTERRPESLPDNWLAYSAFDVIFIQANTFVEKIAEAPRSELLRWVSTGGSIVFYDVDKLEDGLDSINQAIEKSEWGNSEAINSQWNKSSTQKKYMTEEDVRKYRRSVVRHSQRKGDSDKKQKTLDEVAQVVEFSVQTRSLLLGKLMAVDSDPFQSPFLDLLVPLPARFANQRSAAGGNPELIDIESRLEVGHPVWEHIFAQLPTENVSFESRYGMTSRSATSEFLTFVNVGIQKIPTWGFVFLITLFSICIGPLNYWYLRRKNKVSQMLWTTPLIALITSFLLIGWSMVANGSANHVRLRSYSVLDQINQKMVSQNRVAMFTGISQREPLRFEPYSAVFPIWAENDSFKKGSVDWTDAQEFDGFHRANVRSQFYITTPRTERGRLNIGQDSQGLSVDNGLEWGIDFLLIRDSSGDYFFGRRLEAGRSLVLKPATEEGVESLRVRIAQQKLKRPTLVAPPSGSRPVGFYEAEFKVSSHISTNLFERQLSRLATSFSMKIETLKTGEVIDHGIPRSTYLAVLDEPPSLDIGVAKYRPTEQLHVLVGLYE